jgi:hypothetical protein
MIMYFEDKKNIHAWRDFSILFFLYSNKTMELTLQIEKTKVILLF